MQDLNQKNTMSSSISYTHAYDIIQAGRSGDHDTDRFPVDGLLPCTTYPRGTVPPPDPEIPNLAAMSDGERRLWMAPRRDSAAQDQLPRTWCAPDGRPSGDLQPGTQVNRPPPVVPPDRPPSRWFPPRVFPPSPAATGRHFSQLPPATWGWMMC